VIILLGAAIPWPITVHGAFVAQSPLEVALTAPDSSVITAVLAGEGAAVGAGAPILQLRNYRTETELLQEGRAADSLSQLERAARAAGKAGLASELGAERAQAEAERDRLRAHFQAYLLRAPVGGVVVTPRLEERLGSWVNTGDTVARVQTADSVELRVRLEAAGATLVATGQRAVLLPYSSVGQGLQTRVTSVSQVAAGLGGPDGAEARVRVAASPTFRPGVTGEAKIAVRKSNVWGALWWAVRKRVRSDLLL
jgi:multidrug efflux pump subunit AcrA (membrane-fusion protein)